jgi:hypothetical protein
MHPEHLITLLSIPIIGKGDDGDEADVKLVAFGLCVV